MFWNSRPCRNWQGMTALISFQIPSSTRCLGLTGLLALPEHSESPHLRASVLAVYPPEVHSSQMLWWCAPDINHTPARMWLPGKASPSHANYLVALLPPWTSSRLIWSMNCSLLVCWQCGVITLRRALLQGRPFLLYTAIPPGPTIKEEFFLHVLNLWENYWVKKSSGSLLSLLTISQALHLIIRSNNYHLENSPKVRYYILSASHICLI